MCSIAIVDGKRCDNIGQLKKALGVDRVPIDPCYREDYVPSDRDCLCPVNFDVLRKRLNLNIGKNESFDVVITT